MGKDDKCGFVDIGKEIAQDWLRREMNVKKK